MRENSGSTRRYDVDDAFSTDASSPLRPIRGRVRMLRTDKGVWVNAALDTETDGACCRCLSHFRQPVHVDFDEEYLPTPAHGAPPLDEVIYGESFFIDPNHQLDLTEAVRQYAELGSPMKPLCSRSCAGLCPGCGRNLNQADCACNVRFADPRWGPLLDLLPAGRGGNHGVI